MQLTHSFTVPVGADEAFAVLRDIERIGPCMPGATIDSVDGDDFTGRVKVRVGPMQVTYRGQASFTSIDDEARRATITARGREVRGGGTADATVTAECRDRDGSTEVSVVTDLAVTGRPAQFGRSVMSDVGAKLLDQFASCLAEQLASAPAAADTTVPLEDHAPDESVATVPAPSPEPETSRMPPPAAATQRRADEAIDMLELAGGPVLARLAPVLGALAVVVVVWWLVRRRT